MGQIADIGRKLLHHELEASCGDARPDGSCPVFIARHGRDVVTAEVMVDRGDAEHYLSRSRVARAGME